MKHNGFTSIDKELVRKLRLYQKINVPEGIENIKKNAFSNNKSIEILKLPNSLLRIGANAFANTGIKRAYVPSNVRFISVSPFCYCLQLEEINVDVNNKYFYSVDGVLYSKCKQMLKEYPAGKRQEEFSIPEGVKTIEAKAFTGNKYLRKINIPRSMEVISSRAFHGWDGVEEFTVPQWITRIESKAFSYCGMLKKIYIPHGVYVAPDAFEGSDNVNIQYSAIMPQKGIICPKIKVKRIEKKHANEHNQLILSYKFQTNPIFITQVEHAYSTYCKKTRWKKERFTKDILVVEGDKKNIDERGIVKIGTLVGPGDILVCKGVPDDSPEGRLLFAIFGTVSYADVSLRVPYNVRGKVIDVRISYKEDKSGIRDTIECVTVVILQKFPISIGDVLIDEFGTEGVVASFDRSLSEYEVIANCPFGTNVTKKNIAEQAMQVRSVGPYTIIGHRPSANQEHFGVKSYVVAAIPQELLLGDIIKIINNGFGDVLKNILASQSRSNCAKFYRNIIHGDSTDYFDMGRDDINEFYCYIKALCLKPIFRNAQGKELQFSYNEENNELNTVYGDDISLEITELSDSEIQEMSYGEVNRSESINYRTLQPERDGIFCEKIFGSTKDWQCRCGKYRGIFYNGTICENCGVKVTSSIARFERFGHIKLATPIRHPFLPNRMLTFLPVLPPEYRPIIWIENGSFASSDLNELYIRVIRRNNVLKQCIKRGEYSDIISSQKNALQETVEQLFNNTYCKKVYLSSNRYRLKSLSDYLKTFFTKHLKFETLDYSAACYAVINESLPNDKCGLPFQIAAELFKPFLMHKLYNLGIAPTVKTAKRFIEKSINNVNLIQRGMLIDLLEEIIKNRKILVFTKEKTGKVLALSPIITEGNVLTVNLEQYKSLKPQIGEALKIIFPISDAAQDMVKNINESPNEILNDILNQSGADDSIEELTVLSMDEKCDIIPTLVEQIRNCRVCKFDSIISRYVFGKPTRWAWKFFKVKPQKVEVNRKNFESHEKPYEKEDKSVKLSEAGTINDISKNDTNYEIDNLSDDLLFLDDLDTSI